MKVVGPCVNWHGYLNPKGYGQVRVNGRTWLVHRYAWSLQHGDPGDLCVLHACDNPACFNVEHLFLGTKGDNNKDMAAKGRAHRPPMKSHCPEGHPYLRNLNGSPWCRPCHAAYMRRWTSSKS